MYFKIKTQKQNIFCVVDYCMIHFAQPNDLQIGFMVKKQTVLHLTCISIFYFIEKFCK